MRTQIQRSNRHPTAHIVLLVLLFSCLFFSFSMRMCEFMCALARPECRSPRARSFSRPDRCRAFGLTMKRMWWTARCAHITECAQGHNRAKTRARQERYVERCDATLRCDASVHFEWLPCDPNIHSYRHTNTRTRDDTNGPQRPMRETAENGQVMVVVSGPSGATLLRRRASEPNASRGSRAGRAYTPQLT